MVDGAEENILDDSEKASEKALLYIYKSILSDYDVDNVGKDRENFNNLNDIVSNQPTRSTPQFSTEGDVMLDDELAKELLTTETYGIIQQPSPIGNLAVEIVDDWSTLEASVVSYNVKPILNTVDTPVLNTVDTSDNMEPAERPQESAIIQQTSPIGNQAAEIVDAYVVSYDVQPILDTVDTPVLNTLDSPDIVEPTDIPQERVLKEIMNNEKLNLGISISTFFKPPPTPKRKNAKRNYSSKRHFVLTSSERLNELEEKDNEKQNIALQKELKLKERVMKRELKEQEKQERIKMKEQKMKERELNRCLTAESKKVGHIPGGKPKR